MNFNCCCFSGHREVPAADREALEGLLNQYILKIVQTSTTDFICGGAAGFDTMAALAVLRAREQDSRIRLFLALPYRGMEKARKGLQRLEFEYTVSQADEVKYISEAYIKGCMLSRDRYMVDRSRSCICYLTKNTGGTAYTVGYALKNGLEVINLAAEM